MSGIEVAGLILGAFPLLLSALEKNQEAYQVFGDWWKIRKPYESCLKWVHAEHDIFELNLRNLLDPVLADTALLDELLANPYGTEWHSESLADGLRNLLPTNFSNCISIMQEFHEHMIALGRELGMDKQAFQRVMTIVNTVRQASQGGSGKGKIDTRGAVEFEWHRIKFSLNRKRRTGLLANLTTCNRWLERYMIASRGFESFGNTRIVRNIPMPRSLLHFWQHARDLYQLVQQAWSCTCSTSHSTDLLLREYSDPHKTEFKILFSFAENITTQHSGPWDWKETDVVALERSQPQAQVPVDKAMTQVASGTQMPSPSILGSPNKARRDKRSKGVRFIDKAIPVTNMAASLPLQAQLTLPKITDLCTHLAKSGLHGAQIGMLGSDSSSYSVYFPRQKILSKPELRHVTLDEILRSPMRFNLSRRQRYTIALAIASSYVQLHASPWIWARWNKRDIYLLYDSSNSVFYEQPRISKKISKQLPPSPEPQDRSLASLGIMLLELVFGQALEHNRFRLKHPTLNAESDHCLDAAAAKEWCESQAEEDHPHFTEPVLWCLGHATPRTKMDLNNDTWRTDLFNNVVRPISSCCKEHNFKVLAH
ncbi:MAG: hypothetical protein Q9195_005057 [Heterodermia aff. obscurata]